MAFETNPSPPLHPGLGLSVLVPLVLPLPERLMVLTPLQSLVRPIPSREPSPAHVSFIMRKGSG